MNLDSKTIVVTGAASGIGAATARLLTRYGARVIGLDRTDPPEGLVSRHIAVDLMEAPSIDRAIAAINEPIDGLCNIAGVPPSAPVATVVTVNFVALRYLTERLVSKLSGGASIVNMASLAGVGWTESIEHAKKFISEATHDNVERICETLSIDAARSYFFSKEILRIWTMQHWDTWRSQGIRMNTVSPGPVETPILGDFLETLGERADEDMAVMGRAGTAEEIAPLVAFLCSDGSAWINGANIAVDGGMQAHIMRNLHGF